MIDTRNLGADIAVIGSIISGIGVVANNVFLDHILAMQIWVVSNALLLLWSYGLYKNWWNGGISGLALCLMYLLMLVSGVYGLWVS